MAVEVIVLHFKIPSQGQHKQLEREHVLINPYEAEENDTG
jgi:hypothetical protein